MQNGVRPRPGRSFLGDSTSTTVMTALRLTSLISGYRSLLSVGIGSVTV